MKRSVVGILAHVDAGKTTLSEALLFLCGKLKKPGRVDHKDTYLDTHTLERERGITIFSKQALFSTVNFDITLMDTPGHADFSSEMERTLQVLDYAVLIVSGTDGVQAHTETLWNLLRRYKIPTFLFINKMDVPGCDKTALMKELKTSLNENCVDFSSENETERLENISMCEESLLERYMESGTIKDEDIRRLIQEELLFPCYFGSALKLDGVREFINGFDLYASAPSYPKEPFGAKVYKIMRDSQGNRLTCLKITSGRLKVRDTLSYLPRGGEDEEPIQEKISQIRLYSGEKFKQVSEIEAGAACAVSGLSETYPGQGLGCESASGLPFLESVLTYRLLFPADCDIRTMLPKLRQLEEEDPQLRIVWNEELQEVHAVFMGEVQIEVIKSLVLERFGVNIEVDSGRIMYKETISNTVEGVGHYEPLRHYAEVHLILEPLEPGSGLVLDTSCSEDVLDRNWQRLILTHLAEREHPGVLTGSPITDMKITLAAGRAHLKHTEGGDFRQATYRAIRQGLMQAENILLEPYYQFKLSVPSEQIGRAINDIRSMSGTFSAPETHGDFMLLTGSAPVSAMRNYLNEVVAYTRGRGKLSCRVKGFFPCHNTQKALAERNYNPESDLENSPDSIFCAHGAGMVVKWNQVPEYMHLESCLESKKKLSIPSPRVVTKNLNIDEKELEAIMEREFGPIKRPQYTPSVRLSSAKSETAAETIIKTEYLIIDGYNIIFAWDELKALAKPDLNAACTALMDLLANYRGYRRCELIVVFDGYKAKNSSGQRFDYHGIGVVYTKEGETADMYIEKLVHEIGKNEQVRVVTSDNLIQISALRAGVFRMSASEFHDEIKTISKEINLVIEKLQKQKLKTKIEDFGLIQIDAESSTQKKI